jgi:hypothetical protein
MRSLIVHSCKPYQRLHNLVNLDDKSNYTYWGLGPMDISVNNRYDVLGAYKDYTASWETR